MKKTARSAAALAACLLAGIAGCGTEGSTSAQPTHAQESPKDMSKDDASQKSDQEWASCLTPQQYEVLREKGTERAFTGKYYETKTKGVYHCAGCGQALYSSEAKYDSGSGWPSYWEPITPDAVVTETDTSLGMKRTELMCAKCGGHLGHVFEDGPPPTGLRHCINSASLELRPAEGEKVDEDEEQ